MTSGITKCARALDSRKNTYIRCGKPATWVVTDHHSFDPPGSDTPRQYGLCDEHKIGMESWPPRTEPLDARRVEAAAE